MLFDYLISSRKIKNPLGALLQFFIGNQNAMICLPYQSFRFLLYLEWLLLVMAILMELLQPLPLSWSLPLRIMAIAVFGVMGLRLPTGQLITKLFYTTAEFSLIVLSAIENGLSTRAVFLLCLVLLMRSCLIFERTGRLVVLGLSLFSYGTWLLSRPIVPEKLVVTIWDWRLSNVLLYGLTLVFALLLINALLAERQSRSQLENAHQKLAITYEQLRQYSLRIEDQATLQERNRIAREIHDGLGHTLAAQTIQLNNALLFWESNNSKALTFVKQAKQLGAEALLEIRRSVSVLRSNPLYGQSIESAIKKLLTEFQQTTGIEPSAKIDLPELLPTEINTSLYRIVQESLTNIYKHAQAQSVIIKIYEQLGMVHILIEDNGQGFNPNQNTTGFGLQGMRERATAIGGMFHIDSESGTGCRISVSLPLSKIIL